MLNYGTFCRGNVVSPVSQKNEADPAVYPDEAVKK